MEESKTTKPGKMLMVGGDRTSTAKAIEALKHSATHIPPVVLPPKPEKPIPIKRRAYILRNVTSTKGDKGQQASDGTVYVRDERGGLVNTTKQKLTGREKKALKKHKVMTLKQAQREIHKLVKSPAEVMQEIQSNLKERREPNGNGES